MLQQPKETPNKDILISTTFWAPEPDTMILYTS